MLLTRDLPGSGGLLLADPEDFVVHERLAYGAEGAGEHLFVHLEKVGLTTPEAARRVAELAGVRPNDVGWAGLKDRAARARQWLSLPWLVKRPLPALELDMSELRILEARRHGNKLKRSHGVGNRFEITLRSVPPGGAERAAAVLERLRTTGVPNAFGPQRFGRDGDNAERALAVLRKEAPRPRDRRLWSILVSALQSEVFNRVLAARVEAGLLGVALEGDVMKKHDSGGLFDVADAAAEQPRVDRLEISPTAALPGPKARPAHGRPAELEAEALASVGIDAALLDRLDVGTRRALRYPLDPEARIVPLSDDAYRLEIALPSGAFATVVLAELVKPEAGAVLRTPLDEA